MKIIMCVFLVTLSSLATASTVSSAKITQILAGDIFGGKVLLTVSPVPSDTAACQTNPRYTYSFDASTEAGKITLSLALSAYAAGKDVFLNGYATCTEYPGTEKLRQIRVQ